MKIGNVDIPHGLALAPMAGVTDKSFRKISKEFGCEYSVTEMISAKAVYYKDKKTDTLAEIESNEHPIGLQIFGHEFDIMAYAAQVLCEKHSPDIIDINMGCPVHKITSNQEGSALMRDPDNVRKIVKGVVDAVKVPVTVKIRSGWDDNHKNAVDIAKICEYYGASAICVHGRTKTQLYSPPCDLDIIKDVKEAVKIPVFGNGGINNAVDAIHMLEYTNCDGLMIARGCQGNPWIFPEIICALEGKEFIRPSVEERIKTAIRHADLLISEKGEHGILESRKMISWYIFGLEGAAEARGKINVSQTKEEVLSILDVLLEKNRE